MSETFSLDELVRLPHVDQDAAKRGGVICTSTFFTDGQWEVWIAVNGALQRIKIVALNEGGYFGNAAAAPHDLHLKALNLVAQHACFDQTAGHLVGVWDDLYNIAASVAKLDLLMAHQNEVRDQAYGSVLISG